MYTLAPDEKVTPVMVYTQNALVRGELVTKTIARVNIWLRMQAQSYYIHIHKAQVLMFGGPLTKSFSYDELFVPISQVAGFHLVSQGEETLDYDPSEPNRTMHDVQLSLGNFAAKGKVRISTHADFATSIEVAHAGWLSVYDAELTTLFVPQFPAFHTPMMLVNPAFVTFGV